MHAEQSYLESHFPWLEGKVGKFMERVIRKADSFDAGQICDFLKQCPTDKEDDRKIITEEFINEINAIQSSWTAGSNDKFADSSMDDVKKYLGAIIEPDL